MTTKTRGLTSRMEAVIESALVPGRFISYDASFDFVEDLGAVERQIAALVQTAPGRAASLYETFLAGCYEKVEESDDSSGSFGQFVDTLFCGWIKARQAAGADPDETAIRLLEALPGSETVAGGAGLTAGRIKEMARVSLMETSCA